MSRYVIIGAGAVGGTVGAQLHESGFQVALIARGHHLQALREGGLRYIRPDGERRLDVPVFGGPAEISLRPGDVLVVATKAQDAEAVIAEWAWQPVEGRATLSGAALPIVLLQNGLDTARTALRRFSTVLDAAVLIPSSHLVPGEVVSPGTPTVAALYLGRAPSGAPDAVTEAIAADLGKAGFEVAVVDDIARWKAGKLLGNIAYNLDALYGPSDLRTRAAKALRDEAENVLRASGIEPHEIGADGRLDLTGMVVEPIPGHERGGSSTWQSLSRAGSAETDFLYGEVVLQARLLDLEAPLNAAVQQRIARLVRDGGAAGSLDDADLARTLPALATVAESPSRQAATVLVDARQLHAELHSPNPPVLLDVRWALGDPDGQKHYRDAHIPGAVYVDLDTELAAPATPRDGRHPLPDPVALQSAARGWGVSDGRSVVVYDNVGGLSAARAWWLLKWGGVDARILDGALAAWLAEGFESEAGTIVAEPGDVTLRPGQLPVLTADEAAALPERGALLDARAGERYRGEVEPIDLRAGHIPGAISAPTGSNLDADGRFLTPAQLAERFNALGLTGEQVVGVYCGSGVTAAHEIAALTHAGIDAALFPGSWSAWAADTGRPGATGPLPYPE